MEAAPLGRGVAEKRAEMRARYFTREEAGRLGWNVEHPDQGGHFLEEQEVVDYFPALSSALGRERPDFAAIGGDGKPRLVIECKSDSKRLDTALDEAIDYAETMSAVPGFDVRLAVGVAGSPDRRIYTRTRFCHNGTWKDLESFGFPLTQLPTPFETDIAIHRADGTTDVQLPDEREFFDSAISLTESQTARLLTRFRYGPLAARTSGHLPGEGDGDVDAQCGDGERHVPFASDRRRRGVGNRREGQVP